MELYSNHFCTWYTWCLHILSQIHCDERGVNSSTFRSNEYADVGRQLCVAFVLCKLIAASYPLFYVFLMHCYSNLRWYHGSLSASPNKAQQTYRQQYRSFSSIHRIRDIKDFADYSSHSLLIPLLQSTVSLFSPTLLSHKWRPLCFFVNICHPVVLSSVTWLCVGLGPWWPWSSLGCILLTDRRRTSEWWQQLCNLVWQ